MILLRLIQKLCLHSHFYLGLFAGALFVLIGLTGSTLVFYKAIDEWLNPNQLTTAGTGSYKPLSAIVEAARAAGPPEGWLDNIRVPSHEHGTFLAWYKMPTAVPDEFRWFQVTIDPYTATVLSRREWGGYLMSFLYELHESLLFDKAGEAIVGFLGLLLLLSIGTGIFVSRPYHGIFREAFTYNSRASHIRRYYSWHKLSGLFSAIVLSVIATSGLYMEFPTYVLAGVRFFLPLQEMPSLQSVQADMAAPFPIEQAVTTASQLFPEGELKVIGLPRGSTGVYRIVVRQPGEVRQSSGESQVWIDQYSGAVMAIRDWRSLPPGDTLVAWLFPLHNGEAFGLGGRIMVFLTGFVPTLLYVTGLRMWWLKRAAHRKQKAGAPA